MVNVMNKVETFPKHMIEMGKRYESSATGRVSLVFIQEDSFTFISYAILVYQIKKVILEILELLVIKKNTIQEVKISQIKIDMKICKRKFQHFYVRQYYSSNKINYKTL